MRKPRPYHRTDTDIECPHCHAMMRPSLIRRHMQTCLAVPEVYARTRALLSDPAGFIVTIPQYDQASRGRSDVPGRVSLYRKYRTWAGVAAGFGLLYADRGDGRPAKSDRKAMEIGAEIDAEIKADRKAAAERSEPAGLHAYAVTEIQTLIPARVGGAACQVLHTETRYMLR